jgi:hypothetical protein
MNVISKILFSYFGTLAISTAAHAASPLGNWPMNANGYQGTLSVTTFLADGTISGTVLGSPMKGLYSDSQGRIVFYRAINGSISSTPPDQIQVFEGYLHPCNASSPMSTQCIEGRVQGFSGTNGTATKNVWGWYAYK